MKSMEIQCPFCKKKNSVEAGPKRRLATCSQCRRKFHVPSVQEWESKFARSKPESDTEPVQQEEELNSKSVFLGIVIILVMVALIQPGCSYWEWIKYDGMSGPAPKCWWQEGYEEDSKRRRKRYIEEYERDLRSRGIDPDGDMDQFSDPLYNR
jgi:hypothetical protein